MKIKVSEYLKKILKGGCALALVGSLIAPMTGCKADEAETSEITLEQTYDGFINKSSDKIIFTITERTDSQLSGEVINVGASSGNFSTIKDHNRSDNSIKHPQTEYSSLESIFLNKESLVEDLESLQEQFEIINNDNDNFKRDKAIVRTDNGFKIINFDKIEAITHLNGKPWDVTLYTPGNYLYRTNSKDCMIITGNREVVIKPDVLQKFGISQATNQKAK